MVKRLKMRNNMKYDLIAKAYVAMFQESISISKPKYGPIGNTYHNMSSEKEYPAIQCGIGTRVRYSSMMENVDIDGNHDDYIGPENQLPESRGYVHAIKGYGEPTHIYTHKDHPRKFFHFYGTSTPTQFSSFESAANDLKNKIKNTTEANKQSYDFYKNHYAVQQYTPSNIEAIKNYTHDSSLNHYLLNGNDVSAHAKTIQAIDDALQVKKTPHNMVVYTGTDNNHANIVRNNDVVAHPGYISSSLSVDVAAGFANSNNGDIIKIHLPAGHHGIYADPISNHDGEQEFILPRGLKLHFDHSKRQVIKTMYGNFYVHHAYVNPLNSDTDQTTTHRHKNFDITISKSSNFYRTLREYDGSPIDKFHENLAKEFKLTSGREKNFPQKENHIGAKFISQTPKSITIRNMFNEPITEKEHQQFIDAYANVQSGISNSNTFTHVPAKE